MLSKAAEVFAASIALNKDDNSAYGIYRNYFITLSEKKHGKTVVISCYFDEDDDDRIKTLAISDSIKENIGKFHIDDYEFIDDGLRIVSDADISVFRDMLDSVITLLEENDVHGADCCSLCGKPFASGSKKKIVTCDDKRSLVCESCAFELLEESEQTKTAAAEAPKPSLSKLIIGSVVGALLGAIIYAVLFMIPVSEDSSIVKYFVCLAGLAVGAFSFFGAQKSSKCGYTNSLAATTVITSVIFTLIAHYAGCVIYAIRKYADFNIFKFTPAAFFKLVFSNSSLLRFFLAGAVIGLCAAGVALIFTISNLMKKGAETTKKSVTVSTLK